MEGGREEMKYDVFFPPPILPSLPPSLLSSYPASPPSSWRLVPPDGPAS